MIGFHSWFLVEIYPSIHHGCLTDTEMRCRRCPAKQVLSQ